jgi:hypothetical protein
MAMSLTKDDLRAVKQLIDESIDNRVPKIIDARVQPMLDKLEDRTFKRLTNLEGKLNERITNVTSNLEARLIRHMDELDDAMMIQTESGLQDIRNQLGEVNNTLGRVERGQQRATLKA